MCPPTWIRRKRIICLVCIGGKSLCDPQGKDSLSSLIMRIKHMCPPRIGRKKLICLACMGGKSLCVLPG
jgi:hypothetical protein